MSFTFSPSTSALLSNRIIPSATRCYCLLKTGYRIQKIYRRFRTNGLDIVAIINIGSAVLSSASYWSLMTRKSLKMKYLFIKSNINLAQVFIIMSGYLNASTSGPTKVVFKFVISLQNL